MSTAWIYKHHKLVDLLSNVSVLETKETLGYIYRLTCFKWARKHLVLPATITRIQKGKCLLIFDLQLVNYVCVYVKFSRSDDHKQSPGTDCSACNWESSVCLYEANRWKSILALCRLFLSTLLTYLRQFRKSFVFLHHLWKGWLICHVILHIVISFSSDYHWVAMHLYT